MTYWTNLQWYVMDKDLCPIRPSKPFVGAKEEALEEARQHVAETYPNVPARQVHEAVSADRWRMVWTSRFGQEPRWHLFPPEEA